MKSAVLLLAFVLAAPTAAQQSVSADTALTARIARYLGPFAAAGELSGTVLVGRRDSILFERAYGLADYKRGVANTTTTRFGIASLTKPLTGLVVNQLIDAGQLNNSDPVSRWLPDFPRGNDITIALLRAHRSGIPHRVTTLENELKPWKSAELVRAIAAQDLRFEPGSQYLYSSAGFSMLARVVEIASGKTYAELLHTLVLDPAAARQTFDATEPRRPDAIVATGYLRGPDGPVETPPRDLSFLEGAGSVYSTPRDLFAIVRALVNGKYGATSMASADRGIAWNGLSNGYRAFVAYDRATEVTLIFTANLYTGVGDEMRRDLPRIIAGEAVSPAVPARPGLTPLNSEQRSQLEGVYDFGPQQQQLRFISPTLAMLGTEYLMYATSDSTFWSPQDYATLTVQRGMARAVTGMVWKSREVTLQMPRR